METYHIVTLGRNWIRVCCVDNLQHQRSFATPLLLVLPCLQGNAGIILRFRADTALFPSIFEIRSKNTNWRAIKCTVHLCNTSIICLVLVIVSGNGALPHTEVHEILIIKRTRCTNFWNLFWNKTLHISDSSSVHHPEFSTVHTAIGICHRGLLCVQWKTSDDGQRNCPKYVEFYSKVNLRN
jgi:hypothetical protein